jgi:hypothetical protein
MASDMLLAADLKQNIRFMERKKIVLKYFTHFGGIVAP